MTIANKAIAYGDSRYGRSCANCVYREVSPVHGSMCVLHDLPTKLNKCCGTWVGEIVPEPAEEIAQYLNQGELF